MDAEDVEGAVAEAHEGAAEGEEGWAGRCGQRVDREESGDG